MEWSMLYPLAVKSSTAYHYPSPVPKPFNTRSLNIGCNQLRGTSIIKKKKSELPELPVNAVKGKRCPQPLKHIGMQSQAVESFEEGFGVSWTLLLLLWCGLLY